MTICLPSIADADELAAMAARAWTETFAHMYSATDLAAHLQVWMPPARCAAEIANPAVWPIRLWRDDAGISGYIKLGPIDFPLPEDYGDASDSIELHHFYLLERAKGSGAADALMAWALDEARARGKARILLSVFVENHRAQRFYARHGFAEIGKNPYRVGDQIDDDRIWMAAL
ncbi:MAG: GNAT family N-acetyltransferase [Sphingomonadaceae bacterium]|nr:GNAT family N-acetyltransferase [Sphingomonadaceae bacterium]